MEDFANNFEGCLRECFLNGLFNNDWSWCNCDWNHHRFGVNVHWMSMCVGMHWHLDHLWLCNNNWLDDNWFLDDDFSLLFENWNVVWLVAVVSISVKSLHHSLDLLTLGLREGISKFSESVAKSIEFVG